MRLTANEMKYLFQLKFNSLFEFSAPAYDDRQISELLTEAQFRVFLRRYNPFGNKYIKGAESDEQRKRDLEQLIRAGLYTSNGDPIPDGVSEIFQSDVQGGVHPNGIFFDMPDDFLYALEEAVKLEDSTIESIVVPVTHDEYLANINNPFKKPYKRAVWRMEISRANHFDSGEEDSSTSKRTEIILPSGEAIEYYRLRYLAYPPNIVCNEYEPEKQKHCILDGSLHRDIVDEAVSMAKAAVNPEEYQIGLSEQDRSN